MATRLIYIFFAFALIQVGAWGDSRYTLEHAEKLKNSGLIKWRDYGPDVFRAAKKENKPIFLMLTAPSWCYWCHVYSSEDYLYHPDIYPIIDKKFIPVYVDADKRQDLTRQYLEGGWPSTTVMTPGGERLFGYSGPRPVKNMAANLNKAVEYVKKSKFASVIKYDYKKTETVIPDREELENLIRNYRGYISRLYDGTYGGFGMGQKFPQGNTLDFALEIYRQTKNRDFLGMVENTLRNQYTKIDEIETNYNLFDPVEGAFHRYGTRMDWTPPHYEKMLDDNARLLNAYSHLLEIVPGNKIAREVVEKTIKYIDRYWYDKESGGFYGNTDVHGEDRYYGKKKRSLRKPRIEKTKYSDWNSEAVITYLNLWKRRGDEKFRRMAEDTLDFFLHNMITDHGAYHYIKTDGTKKVRGSLLDNAYLLLAFIRGHESIGRPEYRDTAEGIASYMLSNLYDWNSGGFFERNSPDLDLYAPGENIKLSKPGDGNGIVAYGLARLFLITGRPEYLNASIKTMGANILNVQVLDRGYYFVKGARFILKHNLISEYAKIKGKAEKIEKERLENFWLSNLLLKYSKDSLKELREFDISSKGTDLQKGSLLTALIIFISGIISFISFCTITLFLAFAAYSFRSHHVSHLRRTFAFIAGFVLIFTLSGMSIGDTGSILMGKKEILTEIAGIWLFLFGIYIMQVKQLNFLIKRFPLLKTYIGTFLLGALLGIAWAPCDGPVAISLISQSSGSGQSALPILYLFLFSAGIVLPLLIISIFLDRIDKDGRLWSLIKGRELRMKVIKSEFPIHTGLWVSGILHAVLGYLVYSHSLNVMSKYFSDFSYQNWLYGIEKWLLSLIK